MTTRPNPYAALALPDAEAAAAIAADFPEDAVGSMLAHLDGAVPEQVLDNARSLAVLLAGECQGDRIPPRPAPASRGWIVRDCDDLSTLADAGQPDPDEYISTGQAAALLGISRVTLVRFLDEGRLPYTRPGKHRRVRLADVWAFKAETTHGRVAS
jgi:excisionase family DNA binding protein